jgi:CPA2 family monovalent cation:H+ antiporter-2
MPHDAPLIATVAVGFVLALVLALIAHRLRLPPIVGYLLAGVALGPFTPGFVGDVALAGQVAEIGVILLMFGVGLHFSVGDLLAVRQIAVPGALVQIVVATMLGLGLALGWGWSLGAGLVFGLSLSVASTVVLLRALAERGQLDTAQGRIAVGWLIVEDLAMVFVLMLLPALAAPLGGAGADAVAGDAENSNLWLALLVTAGKIVLFVVLVLAVGKRAVPWLLARVARTGSRELFTLSVLAVALGIAYGSATLFGVSFALGAFFAGVVLSESDLSHQAAAESLPLQDAFAVLFFVSVGMLFDPTILVREPLAVLAVLAVILVGNSATAFLLLLAFGRPLTGALMVAAGLSQIGEFSFILTSLGLALELLPAEGKDLILAGALISITLNPLLLAGVRPAAAWLEQRPALRAKLERQVPAMSLTAAAEQTLSGHAVLVGFGRVGRSIARALDAFEMPYTIIERDRIVMEGLRQAGRRVVYGNASAPGILAAGGVQHAQLLIVTAPDGYEVRRTLEIARSLNPGIDTLVRAHSEAEADALERAQVGLAVVAERELALGMMGYALRSLGLSEGQARLYVQSARRFDDAGMSREVDLRGSAAPELRPRRSHAVEEEAG